MNAHKQLSEHKCVILHKYMYITMSHCHDLGNRTSSALSGGQNTEGDVTMMQFLILICLMKLRCLWLSEKKNSTGVLENLS